MRNDNLAHKNEFREETIDGKLIAMSPATSNHNRIAGNIFGIFWSYLRGKKCVPYGDGEYVFLTDDDIFVPDFIFPPVLLKMIKGIRRKSMRNAVSVNTGLSAPRKSQWRFITIPVMHSFSRMFIPLVPNGF